MRQEPNAPKGNKMNQTNNSDMLSQSVNDFIEATAAKSPTPGGGSVAGVVGALGAALGEMALNFTRGKKKFAAHQEYYEHLTRRLKKARRMFADLVADDVAAYRFFQETSRMEDSPEKSEKMRAAVAAAIAVPREATKLSLALLGDLMEFCDKCSKLLISDLVASAALAVATIRLSNYNVRINIPQVDDEQAAKDLKQASADDLKCALKLLEGIERQASEHLG